MSQDPFLKGGVVAALWFAAVVTTSAEPVVVDRKLNFRAGPGAAFSVVSVVPAGATLYVQRCSKAWCRVTLGRRVGYVSRGVLHREADAYASAAPAAEQAASEPKPSRASPRARRWRDSAWRDERWRRIEWLNRMRR
jgi:uncharacterized protein YraI